MENPGRSQNKNNDTTTSLSWLKIEGYRSVTASAEYAKNYGLFQHTINWLKKTETVLNALLNYLKIKIMLLVMAVTLSLLHAKPVCAQLSIGTTVMQVNCNGGANGSITVLLTSGNGPYNYIWNTGATTQIISNLWSDNYTVTVTDASGSSTSETIFVPEPAPIIIIDSVISTPSSTNNTGSIIIAVTGGNPPYSYNWSNGITTQNNTALAAGTYTVTVIDAYGCSTSAVKTLTAGLNITATTTALCSGDCTPLSVANPDPNYYYMWNPGALTGSTVLVCPATTTTYTVIGTDPVTGNQQMATTTIMVAPSEPVNIVANKTMVCSGDCAILNATSANANYVYNWAPATSTGSSVTVCPPVTSTYTVTATDPLTGCTATAAITILVTYCPPLEAHVNFDNCSNNACITVIGGCPPYDYSWCNSALSNDPCYANTFLLPCQTCPVTITDACGNSVNVTVEKPNLTLTSTPASDNGNCDATASVTIGCFGCGNGNLLYQWSNGQTTATATGLCCNTTYTLSVTNCYLNVWTCNITTLDCGCDTVCRNFDDNNSHGWAADPAANNVAVFIANSGSQGGAGDSYILAIDQPGASALMAGPEFNTPWCCGELCFDYKIFSNQNSNPNVNPIVYINGSGANAYKRFTFTFNATVNPADPWQRFCVPTSGPDCALPPVTATGVWTAVATTIPPTLPTDWPSVVSQIGKISFRVDYGTLVNESTGFDNVCYTPITMQVNAGPDLTINQGQSVVLTAQGCSSTAIWHTISGAPLGWSGSSWTVSPTVTTCYVVECGDANCCGATDTVCVTVVPAPQVHFLQDCDSSLCINITGGMPPYSYYWHTSPVRTNCPIKVAPCTDMQVTIFDANGASVVLNHKQALITGNVINATCNPGNGGVILDISCIDTNCLPLTYVWKNMLNNSVVIATTKNLTGVVKGTYCVTAIDACGNEYSCCYEVKCECKWDGCIKYNTNNGALSITNFNTPVAGCSFTYKWRTNTGYTHTGNNWAAVPPFSSVTLNVISCCGDTVTKTFTPLSNLVLTKTDPCCTDSDGVITISNIMGGSQPCTGYTYEWQVAVAQNGPWIKVIGAAGVQLFNCKAGMWYRVKVKDCCGNSITSAPIKIGNYYSFAVFGLTANAADCSLLGTYNGSVSFQVTSSCADILYSYSYFPFANCPCLPYAHSIGQQLLSVGPNGMVSLSNLAPGTYTFFLVRCNKLYQFTAVVHFKKPTFTYRFTNCGSTVCIEANACCGVTYLWSNGATVQCQYNLIAGTTYTATVTDCEGQKTTRTIKIPKVTATVNNANCGAATGSISLNVAYWNLPFTHHWDNDTFSLLSSTSTINSGNRAPGQHCVTLTNDKGDKWECCYNIVAKSAVSFVISLGACRNNCITVLTGTPNYKYEWRNCITNAIVSKSNCYDVCGCYIVKVTDNNGCTAEQLYNITGVKISPVDSCGLCADVCGGCAPYNYLWSNGETKQCIKCLQPGSNTYTVTVTDCQGNTASCSYSITINPLWASVINVTATNLMVKVSGGCLPYTLDYKKGGDPWVTFLGTNNPKTFAVPNTATNDWYQINIHDACGHTVNTFQFYAKEGMSTLESKNELLNPLIVPNPNNGVFNIMFDQAWQNQKVEYQILDLAGKLILKDQITVDGQLYSINLSAQPKGLYIIHYSTMNASYTSKIVIE